MNRYQAIVPLVVVKLTTGVDQYIYEGGFLPSEASPSHVEFLLEQGAIKEIKQ